MNTQFWLDALKNNWYLVAAILVCVGAFAYKVSVSGEPAATGPPEQPYAARQANLPQDNLGTLQRSVRDDREHARKVIESHQARIEQDPTSEEAPAYIAAVGNLYRQKLGNYEEAIRCYERVLSDYADSRSVRAALIHLADCYERKGDTTNARRVYRQMMDRYPEDTQEHKYAYAMMYNGTDGTDSES